MHAAALGGTPSGILSVSQQVHVFCAAQLRWTHSYTTPRCVLRVGSSCWQCSRIVMAMCAQACAVSAPRARLLSLGSCRRAAFAKPVRSVITTRRAKRQLRTVAHSSVLLPDVSPEANVPPAVANMIVEYARAMPTWEVCTRAALEIGVSVLLAFLVVKAIQRATSQAIQASTAQALCLDPVLTCCVQHLWHTLASATWS